MNPTADYLRSLVRTIADNVLATIVTRNDDDTYMCELITTKAILRAAKANPIDEFAIGSRVLLSMPSASRNVVGAMPVIVSRAPREQRGLSGTTPDEDERTTTAATIISFDPDPAIVIAGGEPVEQTITGFGLGVAAEYVGDDGTPAIGVTAEAVSISGTQVVMSITVAAGTPQSEWGVSVNGVYIRDALHIREGLGPQPSIWALAYVDPDLFLPHLLRIDPATMEVFRDYVLDDTSIQDLARLGRVIAVKTGSKLTRVDRLNGDDEAPVAVSNPGFDNLTAGVKPTGGGAPGGHLYYGSTTNLIALDVATAAEVLAPYDSPISDTYSVVIDGTTAWIAGGNNLVKFDLTAGEEIDRAAFNEARELAVTAGAVWMLRSDNAIPPYGARTLSKIDKTTLAELDSVEILAADSTAHGTTQLRADGDYIYGTMQMQGAGGDFFFRVHATTLVLSTIAIAELPTGFAISGGFAFVGDYSGGITVINLTTSATVARYQFDAVEIDRIVYA